MNSIDSRYHRRFAFASRRVVFPDGVRPAVVPIDGDQIAEIVEVPASAGIEGRGQQFRAS